MTKDEQIKSYMDLLLHTNNLFGWIYDEHMQMLFTTYPGDDYQGFEKSVSHYFKMFSIYTASAVAVGGFTYFVCSFIVMGGLLEIFLKLVVCTAMYNILLMLLYGRTVEYKEFMEKLIGLIEGRMRRELTGLRKVLMR